MRCRKRQGLVTQAAQRIRCIPATSASVRFLLQHSSGDDGSTYTPLLFAPSNVQSPAVQPVCPPVMSCAMVANLTMSAPAP